jgi:hypothetical protein
LTAAVSSRILRKVPSRFAAFDGDSRLTNLRREIGGSGGLPHTVESDWVRVLSEGWSVNVLRDRVRGEQVEEKRIGNEGEEGLGNIRATSKGVVGIEMLHKPSTTRSKHSNPTSPYIRGRVLLSVYFQD